MPDLKLAALMEATQPRRLQAALEPFLGPGATRPEVETTRLQAPICYWAVYRSGTRRATLKSFFSSDDFDQYRTKLAGYYPDRINRPDHVRGGFTLLPELNALLWSFPFDPAMPSLHRCLDGDWIAGTLRRQTLTTVEPELVNYNPEIGAIFAYRHPVRKRIIAYGKAAPDETCGLIYVVMDRLWRSPAREQGWLQLARPLAFRPDVGLLLQSAVRGRSIDSDRNRRLFLDLVESAGLALAAIQGADIPFGPVRQLEHLLRRLKGGLEDIALTAPALYQTLRELIHHIETRARRSEPGPLVPSHGDFKWDQFLHYRHRFSLIDFELFCRAEPTYDAGYFCAYLPPSSPQDWRDSAAAEVLRSAFLRVYEDATGVPLDLSRLALHESAMLAVRALSYAWQHLSGWELRASSLLSLAFERLVSPEPAPLERFDVSFAPNRAHARA